MKLNYVLLVVLVLLIQHDQSRGQAIKAKPDQYIISKMKEYKIPGLSVIVIKNGKVTQKANYGTASVEFNIPVTGKTVFHLASATKIFTSTVIMKLVESGTLSLDRSVTEFLDSLPETWKEIRIENLLNHTSGIKNHFQTKSWNSFQRDVQDKFTFRQVIQFSIDEPLMFAPGQKWSYNVTGYMILGMIAEKVTGKPIDVLAKELIYQPLNMMQTQYGDYRAIIKNRGSLVYTYQRGPFETWNFSYGLSGTTAAGLNTTTTDLAKFFIAMDAGKVLKKETMDKMMTPTILPDGTRQNYGLGWAIYENNGKFCYGHEGGGCAWIDYYRKEHLTVIVLCNLAGSKANEIVKGVAGFYLNK